MALFERVFRGSDEMFFKAEAEVDAAIAELGASAPIAMPSTAYHLACSYAYLGKKITNLGKYLFGFNFINAKKSDSQDICFVTDSKYAEFIEEYTGKKSMPVAAFLNGVRGEKIEFLPGITPDNTTL